MTFSEINATKNVRKMSWDFLNTYDGASYRTQLVEKERRKRKKETENINRKVDIFPVITFVIYYGEEEWRHETTLHKRLNLDSELKHYVSDYSINLIDLKKLSEDDITDNDIVSV